MRDVPAQVTSRDTTVPVLLAAAGAGLVAYLVLFSYRVDYTGHYLAGAGLTALLVGLTGARTSRPEAVVAAVALTAAAGAVTEDLFFTSFFYDPIDVANLTLGALVAGAALVDRPVSRHVPALAVLGLVAIGTGFVLRYANLGTGP